MDSLNLVDADDIVETAHNCLDDLWKLDEYRYPQERMEHLMAVSYTHLDVYKRQHVHDELVY